MTDQHGWRSKAGTLFACEKQSVYGSRGAVAANNPIGAAAGVEMLAMGGNAMDAAIATLFTLNVVEPQMVGVLGAGWMNIRLADGTPIIIDNYSTAPAGATPDMYRPISDTWPDYMQTEGSENKVGYLSVGVPAALKGWAEVIDNWGRLDMETVMQPAIRHAERGFRISEYLRTSIVNSRHDLARFPDSARTFLPNGEPPAGGDLIVQTDLAESLRTIASEGPEVLYGGALGQVIADDVQKNGGVLTIEDLRTYRAERRQPILDTYREYELTVPSPPCSGGVHILQILHLLEGFDVAALGFGTADSIHLLAECFKIAFADRTAYMGDPAEMDVPVEWLTSPDYAAHRRAGIDMQQAAYPNPGIPPSPESASTTHVTAADADGNIAAITQTINEGFGSKVMVPGTGLFLNNTMALFDPHPGHPNSVGPSRQMISSNSPTIITKNGNPYMALGTPGGVRIFPSVAQAIVNVIDHGMTLQEAVEAPRVWTQGQALEVESAVPDSVQSALSERGHDVLAVRTVAGGMNGVMFDPDMGMIAGAACWRADGAPVALSGGPARSGVRFRLAVSRDDKA
ncbi:MAG: gamma-glutamyltransferase [Candidatus Poribacteria bacterium]|nr:gamma-glutamyltransferase [Candidatus Poribacteria bacterium]